MCLAVPSARQEAQVFSVGLSLSVLFFILLRAIRQIICAELFPRHNSRITNWEFEIVDRTCEVGVWSVLSAYCRNERQWQIELSSRKLCNLVRLSR